MNKKEIKELLSPFDANLAKTGVNFDGKKIRKNLKIFLINTLNS